MSAVRRAEVRVTLLKEAEGIAARLRANDAERSELLVQRAGACKALRAAGTPIKDLEEVLGVSRSRINQMLSDSG